MSDDNKHKWENRLQKYFGGIGLILGEALDEDREYRKRFKPMHKSTNPNQEERWKENAPKRD